MPFLVALVILVGAIGVLNLVLLLGVIRRLREHTELISTNAQAAIPQVMLATGETPEDFEAIATTGEVVTRDGLTGHTLLGVFSPDCPGCAERLPAFLELAGDFKGGRDQVLAVVVAPGGDAEPYRGKLESVARVVVEDRRHGINEALKIKAFPAIGMLGPGGTVVDDDLRLTAATPVGA